MSPPKLDVLAMALAFAYPVLVYIGIRKGIPFQWMAMFLLTILALRWGKALTRKVPPPFLILAVLIALALIWFRAEASVLFYPVIINLTFLAIFGMSLWAGTPIIEKLARIRNPELGEAGIRYTRKVTVMWCMFFAGNGSLALITALSDNAALWAFYNGFLAYVIMGLLFAGEWLVRRRVMMTRGIR